MNLTRALALVAVVASTGCHDEVKPPPPPPVPGPNIDAQLKQHEELTADMKRLQDEFVAALGMYEAAKEQYQAQVATNMVKYKALPRAITQITEMTHDGDRIAQELISSVKSLNDALVSRADSVRKMMAIQARLWDVESRYFRGLKAAAAKAPDESKKLEDARNDVHTKQLEEQAALKALNDKELEAWAGVLDDPKVRDGMDNQLNDLRATLDKSFAALLESALAFDQAEDKLHHKLQTVVAVGDPASFKILQGAEQRAQTATDVAKARGQLKQAILTRAEKRAQEVAYDSEINVVLTTAFKTAKQRDDFFVSVIGQRDHASDLRLKMQQKENELAEARKKLVGLEAEIQKLGY